MKKATWGISLLKIALSVLFLCLVILPLIRMLLYMAQVDVLGIITSKRFVKALGNSLYVSLISTALSVGLAFLLSWCVVRTRARGRSVWSSLFTLPMLIPSVSHGMGLIILFGANGILTNLLGLRGNIYGFWGIVIGSVMYSFPVAYLMLADVLRYEDSTPYEAAAVLGIDRWHQLTAITLPYMRKPLVSVVFAVFTMIITDYGVPLMIGGQFMTLPVMMYQDVIGLLDFGKGSVIGFVLLMPALIAFLVDLANKDRGNQSYVAKPFSIRPEKGRDRVAMLVCAVVSVLVLLPIGVFMLLSFVEKYPVSMSFSLRNIQRALDMKMGQYLLNSLYIALAVATLGTLISFVIGYLTARTPGKSSRALHLISITTLAVPGIVLGLSYVLFFKGTFLYGTFAILIMVNFVHFMASPYLMAHNTFTKLNQNLEAVGQTLGISRFRIVLDVLLPQMRGTIAEMFSYFFINAMMTISAVSYLSTVTTKPVSLMITAFEAQMMLESSAFVSLLILVCNVLMKGLLHLFKRKTAIQSGDAA